MLGPNPAQQKCGGKAKKARNPRGKTQLATTKEAKIKED
jgi:hypothetical protein